MQGLFKRVNKGVYPKIGPNYSKELSNLIKLMLQVNAANRPSSEELLNHPMLLAKAKKLCPQIYNDIKSSKIGQDQLLKTIYVPKFQNSKEKTEEQATKMMSQSETQKMD